MSLPNMGQTIRRLAGLFAFSGALSLVSESSLCASVGPTTLKKLTMGAEYIVAGRVTSVIEIKGVWVATLRPNRILKGIEVPEIVFLAQATWTCDISGAEQGEEVLLFLQRYEFDPHPQPEHERNPAVWTSTFKEPAGFKEAVHEIGLKAPFMVISWSGRGRMPVRYVDGEAYATIWTEDVLLPRAVPTIDGPEEEYASFIRSVRMNKILSLIRNWSDTVR